MRENAGRVHDEALRSWALVDDAIVDEPRPAIPLNQA
jgi:hypothetical protein